VIAQHDIDYALDRTARSVSSFKIERLPSGYAVVHEAARRSKRSASGSPPSARR
jgi:hypothetical protein